jgi:hypothetical protein
VKPTKCLQSQKIGGLHPPYWDRLLGDRQEINDQGESEPLHRGAIMMSRKKANHHKLMTWDSGPGYLVPKRSFSIKIGSEWLTASSESCILAGDKNSSVTELGDIDFARYLS